MKGLFLIFHGFESYNGISKKIHAQFKAFQECGVEMHLCYILIDSKGFQQRIIDHHVLEILGRGVAATLKKWIDYRALLHYIIEHNIDFLYIRSYHNATPFLISALKTLKKNGIKILLEIPTYPYDGEYRNSRIKKRYQLFIDKCFRHSLSKQVTRIVTFSPYDTIFSTPTIRISNGIDFESTPLRQKPQNKTQIRLLGVAEIHSWHGFDRLIAGMANYFQLSPSIQVYFDIVGYGDERIIESLKSMIKSYYLETFVTFHGPKFGKELDVFFNNSDIGVASLARHRSNITYIKTLKNREYAARGIPFIYSEIDEDFEGMPYVMKVPADESPINIESLIEFYYKNTLDPSEIRESVAYLSWEKQMQEVLDSIDITNYES
ncbi:MAG: glycosyltransferase [Tissierellia bacterium]|nr:glycosyltransferase [Candidatus Cloacimonadota bacterium]MDD4088888.1 glycosyltransferase [Tissierellia bacterium]